MGKNRSGSAERQEPAARQFMAFPVAVVIASSSPALSWSCVHALTGGGRPASSAVPSASPWAAAYTCEPQDLSICSLDTRRYVTSVTSLYVYSPRVGHT